MYSFSDLTKQVHLINDLILSDMLNEKDDNSEEAISFSHHLMSTKSWFARISWPNKKRYLLALIRDLRSAWALSLVLKSIWNCRPKDAVLSASDNPVWSSYDQVPLDNNRTAQPTAILAQVMTNDRLWFLSLEPESQAIVLSELLTITGGPVMWEVLKSAQGVYDKYREDMLRNIQECTVVLDPSKAAKTSPPGSANKKDAPQQRPKATASQAHTEQSVPAQKELEASLVAWNATIKSLRDSMKLEELEMTFNDGTKQKIWKVNRPKPELVETVDFVQLLPSAIGKMILSYLPRTQLGDYARVNKYWAYLVDDFKAELAARQKINTDLDKLKELMLRHDSSLNTLANWDFQVGEPSHLSGATLHKQRHQILPSMRTSFKSAGAISFRRMLKDNKRKPVVVQKPLRNLAELSERLDKRGAADENMPLWCKNVIRQAKSSNNKKKFNLREEEGVLQLHNLHFPCPLMKLEFDVPLETPLYKDPSAIKSSKPGRNITNEIISRGPKPQEQKRYNLWTRDFSNLFPVFKIPSHQCPI